MLSPLTNIYKVPQDPLCENKLEYLVVYGRASMGDYYRFAYRILAGFRELLTHGQKFDPESLYKPI